jgi:Transposase IS116/IS110/IS902 family
LNDAIQQSPIWREEALFRSVPGVGRQWWRRSLQACRNLRQLNSREVSALVGVAPFNQDGGALRGRRTIYGGRANVRAALYMAALVATRHNHSIRTFYERLLAQNKPKKLAYESSLPSSTRWPGQMAFATAGASMKTRQLLTLCSRATDSGSESNLHQNLQTPIAASLSDSPGAGIAKLSSWPSGSVMWK